MITKILVNGDLLEVFRAWSGALYLGRKMGSSFKAKVYSYSENIALNFGNKSEIELKRDPVSLFPIISILFYLA